MKTIHALIIMNLFFGMTSSYAMNHGSSPESLKRNVSAIETKPSWAELLHWHKATRKEFRQRLEEDERREKAAQEQEKIKQERFAAWLAQCDSRSE